MRFVCIFAAFFAALLTLPQHAGAELSPEVAEAVKAAQYGRATPEQKNLLTKQRDAIRQARLNGEISKSQFQAAHHWAEQEAPIKQSSPFTPEEWNRVAETHQALNHTPVSEMPPEPKPVQRQAASGSYSSFDDDGYESDRPSEQRATSQPEQQPAKTLTPEERAKYWQDVKESSAMSGDNVSKYMTPEERAEARDAYRRMNEGEAPAKAESAQRTQGDAVRSAESSSVRQGEAARTVEPIATRSEAINSSRTMGNESVKSGQGIKESSIQARDTSFNAERTQGGESFSSERTGAKVSENVSSTRSGSFNAERTAGGQSGSFNGQRTLGGETGAKSSTGAGDAFNAQRTGGGETITKSQPAPAGDNFNAQRTMGGEAEGSRSAAGRPPELQTHNLNEGISEGHPQYDNLQKAAREARGAAGTTPEGVKVASVPESKPFYGSQEAPNAPKGARYSGGIQSEAGGGAQSVGDLRSRQLTESAQSGMDAQTKAAYDNFQRGNASEADLMTLRRNNQQMQMDAHRGNIPKDNYVKLQNDFNQWMDKNVQQAAGDAGLVGRKQVSSGSPNPGTDFDGLAAPKEGQTATPEQYRQARQNLNEIVNKQLKDAGLKPLDNPSRQLETDIMPDSEKVSPETFREVEKMVNRDGGVMYGDQRAAKVERQIRAGELPTAQDNVSHMQEQVRQAKSHIAEGGKLIDEGRHLMNENKPGTEGYRQGQEMVERGQLRAEQGIKYEQRLQGGDGRLGAQTVKDGTPFRPDTPSQRILEQIAGKRPLETRPSVDGGKGAYEMAAEQARANAPAGTDPAEVNRMAEEAGKRAQGQVERLDNIYKKNFQEAEQAALKQGKDPATARTIAEQAGERARGQAQLGTVAATSDNRISQRQQAASEKLQGAGRPDLTAEMARNMSPAERGQLLDNTYNRAYEEAKRGLGNLSPEEAHRIADQAAIREQNKLAGEMRKNSIGDKWNAAENRWEQNSQMGGRTPESKVSAKPGMIQNGRNLLEGSLEGASGVDTAIAEGMGNRMGVGAPGADSSGLRRGLNSAGTANVIDKGFKGLLIGETVKDLSQYAGEYGVAMDPTTTDADAKENFQNMENTGKKMAVGGSVGAALAVTPGGNLVGAGLAGYAGGRWVMENTETGQKIENLKVDAVDGVTRAGESISDTMTGWAGGETVQMAEDGRIKDIQLAHLHALERGDIQLKPGQTLQDLMNDIKRGGPSVTGSGLVEKSARDDLSQIDKLIGTTRPGSDESDILNRIAIDIAHGTPEEKAAARAALEDIKRLDAAGDRTWGSPPVTDRFADAHQQDELSRINRLIANTDDPEERARLKDIRAGLESDDDDVRNSAWAEMNNAQRRYDEAHPPPEETGESRGVAQISDKGRGLGGDVAMIQEGGKPNLGAMVTDTGEPYVPGPRWSAEGLRNDNYNMANLESGALDDIRNLREQLKNARNPADRAALSQQLQDKLNDLTDIQNRIAENNQLLADQGASPDGPTAGQLQQAQEGYNGQVDDLTAQINNIRQQLGRNQRPREHAALAGTAGRIAGTAWRCAEQLGERQSPDRRNAPTEPAGWSVAMDHRGPGERHQQHAKSRGEPTERHRRPSEPAGQLAQLDRTTGHPGRNRAAPGGNRCP